MSDKSKPKQMKVLGLGWSRTGTMSFYLALQQLGYKPYHMNQVILNVEDLFPRWTKATEAMYTSQNKEYRKDVAKMLADYDAVLDLPAIIFYEDLIQMYPDAKVVLTTRDPDSWVGSMTPTIFPMVTDRGWRLISYLEPMHTGKIVRYFDTTFGHWCKFDFGAGARAAFVQHNEHIRRLVPKDRLLEFHPSQGWEPLCRFLDVPTPETPFPKINDTKEFIWRFHVLYKGSAAFGALVNVVMVTAPVVAAVFAFRWYQK